jgi:FkbM family methyltransferase
LITDRIYRLARHWPFLGRQVSKVVRRLPHRVRRVSRFGQELLLDPVELHGFFLYYEREYDDYIFTFLASRLPTYAWAIDVGANIGIYTVFLGSRCGRVDAFEPEPRVLARLRENLELNHLHCVTIHEQCVAHVSGEIPFVSPDLQNEGIGHIASAGMPRPCVTLDDFLASAEPKPLLVKLDIEGGEWLAVQGMQQTVRRWEAPLSMLIEVHREEIARLGGSVGGLRRMIEDLGLEVLALDPGGLTAYHDGARFWWVTNKHV